MPNSAHTVEDYLAGLPGDRREIVRAVREVVLANLPEGYEEGIEFGMISWHIPLSRYPKTYNGRPLGYVALASQKNYLSLYLMGVYGGADGVGDFRKRYEATGKKLNMGKSCVRFTKLDDLPLELIGEVVGEVSVEQYIEVYERARGPR